jgi:hypothetical protein
VREGGPSGTFFIPDIARGTMAEMLTFIATNNDAKRKIYTNFADTSLITAWREWMSANPALALTEMP